MLLEVFECSGRLGLVLQKGDGSICLADLPTYIEMMEHQLKRLTREMFDRLQNMARDEIMNLPPASRLPETEFGCENFESTVFFPFIRDFTSAIRKAFSNIQFWIQLLIFDPRKL